VFKQTGATMMEVLVSLFIASVGLLGIVSIQTMRVQSAHQEIQMSTANLLAGEMAERLRTNRPGVALGYYNAIDTQDSFTDVVCKPCSFEQIRDRDIAQWAARLETYLVEGEGVISVVPGQVGSFTIQISWLNRDETSEHILLVDI
jgi:type IV pilus assembly protein PilV